MRNLLLLLIIGFSANVLIAQRQPTSQPNTPKTNVAPAKTQRQPAEQSAAADRSGTTKTTTAAKRTTPRNAAYPAPAIQPTKVNETQGATDRTPASSTNQAAPNVAAPVVATVEAKPMRVNWMTLEEALEKSKTEKRKFFIDVYTQWCGWCKRMDETTFSDPRVVAYLNEHYYAVKFDAEQTQDIIFREKTYRFKKVGNRGYHELASEWLNNRLSFPTTVFLNEDLEVIQPLPGYLDAPKFETIITYFGTDSHKKTPWETYEKNFASNRNR